MWILIWMSCLTWNKSFLYVLHIFLERVCLLLMEQPIVWATHWMISWICRNRQESKQCHTHSYWLEWCMENVQNWVCNFFTGQPFYFLSFFFLEILSRILIWELQINLTLCWDTLQSTQFQLISLFSYEESSNITNTTPQHMWPDQVEWVTCQPWSKMSFWYGYEKLHIESFQKLITCRHDFSLLSCFNYLHGKTIKYRWNYIHSYRRWAGKRSYVYLAPEHELLSNI